MDGQSVERLMDIILQMKINLAHINETLHQQTYEIRQQLGAVYEEEKKSLDHCLADIDEKLKECAVSIDDYRSSTRPSPACAPDSFSSAAIRAFCRTLYLRSPSTA